ncbi:MAG: signal peptide peptidase SppA [Planctomycetaceae bacterium]|nr:signal peptide peptidase SppA [Planctomycetaceae bacterium]
MITRCAVQRARFFTGCRLKSVIFSTAVYFVFQLVGSLERNYVFADEERFIAGISLTGSLSDGVGQEGLLGDVAPRLSRMLKRLEDAAKDESVRGVLLSIQSPRLGRARVLELRESIQHIRDQGKPVVAHLISGEPLDYSVAAACDRVVMPPAATLAITGVRTEVTFYKGLLDRLGIQAEILQVGEFKGAGEPLTRVSMSPQLRQQYESFVGDLFEQMVEQISEDRSLEKEKVRELIDIGIFTPDQAVQASLVDGIAYEDEVLSGFSASSADSLQDFRRDYGKQDVDTDFSGLSGFMKLVDILSGTEKISQKNASKRIAIIHVQGEIVDGRGSVGMFGGSAAGSEAITKAIRQASEDASVAALVIPINSPGGSALASDLIWRELDRCHKPIVASLSDTAASGGYYIAVAADEIVAAPGTLTGSIGVVGGKIAIGGALNRYGIHTDVVSRGRNAGWLSSQEPFTASEKNAFRTTMEDVYRLFTSKVAQGRKLDREHLDSLAEGRVFTGRMAHSAGLVDSLGTLEDAVLRAGQLADIADPSSAERLLLPKPRGFFDEFLGVNETRQVLPVESRTTEVIMMRLFGLLGESKRNDLIIAGLSSKFRLLSLVASGKPLMLLPAIVETH